MQRSERTSTTMAAMDKDIQIVISKLETTGVSLRALMRPDQQEIKKTYAIFKDSVTKMEEKE